MGWDVELRLCKPGSAHKLTVPSEPYKKPFLGELLFSRDRVGGVECIVALKYVEYGVYGDLISIYPKPYSI